MKQTTKLDSLITSVLKEELGEAERYAGKNAEIEARKDQNFSKLSSETQKNVLDKLRKGGSVTLENEGQNEEQAPQATDIAGKIAEMIDSLSKISEASSDLKVQKIAGKAASQLEIAKSTLESLTAHEVMLNEKEHEKYVKNAGKKRKNIERYLSKSVKMPDVVEKLMKKLPDEKIAEMMKKSKGELDEKKLANAMMKVALKESYIKQDLKKK